MLEIVSLKNLTIPSPKLFNVPAQSSHHCLYCNIEQLLEQIHIWHFPQHTAVVVQDWIDDL